MKKLLFLLCAMFLSFWIVGIASAVPITGSLWHNETVSSNAGSTEADTYLTTDLNTTLGSPTDTFTVSAIDAYDAAAEPILNYNDFLTANGAAIQPSSWSGPNQYTTMSTSPTKAAFFKFEGTGYFTDGMTITHDDGAVLFLDNGSVQYTFDFSVPSSPRTDTLSGLVAGNYNFVLNYAAWNSDPEQIQMDVNNPVPEPATMLLLGSGLIGFAGFGRKKFRKR